MVDERKTQHGRHRLWRLIFGTSVLLLMLAIVISVVSIHNRRSRVGTLRQSGAIVYFSSDEILLRDYVPLFNGRYDPHAFERRPISNGRYLLGHGRSEQVRISRQGELSLIVLDSEDIDRIIAVKLSGKEISDTTLKTVAQRMQDLPEVDTLMIENTQITDAGLEYLKDVK